MLIAPFNDVEFSEAVKKSGFVAGRSITENVFVALEIIYYLKCKTRGKKGEATLKIDISKSYDRVEWNYFFRILERMGFNSVWITCVLLQ